MKTVAAFAEYDSVLNLDPDERAVAQKFHAGVTDDLKERGLIQSAFLQGSFARKTMLNPLRDIDKVVVLVDTYRHLQDEPGGAQAAARLFEGALQDAYPDAKFGRARHAIQMDLGEDTFSFDVVPAFEVDDGTGDVMIMDLGKTLVESGWERSNTRALMHVIAERNGECGGAFIHSVRHVKHFAKWKLGKQLPGLHVEALAYACVDKKLSYPEAAHLIFACGAERLVAGYDDPTGREHLSDKLDLGDRLLAQAAFADAAERAGRALDLAAQGDDAGAVAIWHDIFGGAFPGVEERERKFLAGLYRGAGVTAGAAAVRPTRAWRPC